MAPWRGAVPRLGLPARALDVERVRDLRAAVDLPGDVDLVVLAVGPDPQAPQNQRQKPSLPSFARSASKTRTPSSTR